MNEYTIMTVHGGGRLLRTILIPTAQVHSRDKTDLEDIAANYGQQVVFHDEVGWMGIEAAKFALHEMNGGLKCPGCDACTPRGKHGWVNDECALKSAKEKG